MLHSHLYGQEYCTYEKSLEPSLFLKRALPRAGLEVFPVAGHCLNLEEPERFNRALLAFLTAVDGGTWPRRDARAMPTIPKRAKMAPAPRRKGLKTASAPRHQGAKARRKRK